MLNFGKIGKVADRLLSRLPPQIFPSLVVEFAARGSGVMIGLIQKRYYFGAEQRIRGILLAPRFHTEDLKVGRGVIIEAWENISLGKGVTLHAGVYLDATTKQGRIVIGDRSHIDRNSILYGQGGITIGHGCAIASGVIIYSQTNQYNVSPLVPILDQGTRYSEVTIGQDVWIGAGAILLPGVIVGDHAVIAAGAVVREEVAPWQVVGGVPAKILKDRRS